MPRGLGGMECCQEEEIEIFGDREFFLSCLIAEIDELEISDDAGATEVALSELKAKVPGALGGSVQKGGSSSSSARPTLVDFPLEIGECNSSVDSRTGAPLDLKQVRAGRTKELTAMQRFAVWDYVPEGEARGGQTVKVKWVEDQRGPDTVRSRLVCMQFNFSLRGACFAGTPPLLLVQYILSRAATLGDDRVVGIWDVSCAFLHAPMDEVLYLRLPPGLCPEGYRGRCLKALYGSRRAGLLWGEEIWTQLKSKGFKRR